MNNWFIGQCLRALTAPFSHNSFSQFRNFSNTHGKIIAANVNANSVVRYFCLQEIRIP